MNAKDIHLNQLLQHRKLRHISKHIALVRSVQKDLEKVLPERFRGKCRVLHIRSSTLILSVRSAIIATQMRLITEQLLYELHKQGGQVAKNIKRIKIRMKPATIDLTSNRRRQTLDKETASQFEQLSRRVSDKKLALSLGRLARLATE